MTVSIFITLLSIFSVATSLFTEAIKKLYAESGAQYSANLVACIIGCVIGIGGTACFYVFDSVAWTVPNIISMVLMGVASSIGAMVGYDKLIQMVEQIKG